MKQSIQLTLAILLSCLAPLRAEDIQPYEELVQARLQEAIAATSQLPERLWKPNPGQGIHMALLFLTENQNLEEAERIIAAHCGNPLTEYLGKPVPQSRNEALFRIYLTEQTRQRLSPKAKALATIEDFARLLLTEHHRGVTRADEAVISYPGYEDLVLEF